MNEWKEHFFSEAIEICPTVSLKGTDSYSYVEMKDLSDGNRYCHPSIQRKLSGGSRFKERDTLFARITPCLENGKICQVTGLKNSVGFGSTEFLVFRGKKGITDNDFVFYLSRSEGIRSFAEQNFNGTSGRQRVPKSTFDNLLILLPSLPEQSAIAGVLSSLDDKIDLLHQQNKTLEAMAETIFRQWFLEGESNSATVCLNDYVNCINGVSYKSAELNPSKNALVTLKSFNRYGGFSTEGFKEFTGKYKPQQTVLEGDLVVAHTDITQEADVLGNPALIISSPRYETLVISMDLVKVVPKVDWLSKEFLYFLMRSREFKYHCLGCANGTTVLHLSKEAIPTYEFSTPDRNKVTEFSKYVKELIHQIFIKNKQIHTLMQLRDTLLPKLMSGEVKVKV